MRALDVTTFTAVDVNDRDGRACIKTPKISSETLQRGPSCARWT